MTLDKSQYDKGLDSAESSANSFGSKLKSGLGAVGKGAAVAIGVTATAVSKLTSESISAYAEQEQLIGGVKTLFGESAYDVINNANNAFVNAGMSMNEYMETSIQSAAALIQSLGGNQAEAADLMNTSIIDMADNVNKMGTTMESVQNAYRGFSRGNFTMLDNLALGFSGTKEGMQELLDKANQINKAHGVMSEYAIDSYSDIVKAIHVVQDEMGITNTTADEAATTIQGSTASVKSAWKNLIAGLGDENANLGTLINNLVTSLTSGSDNIVPRITSILSGIGTAITMLAPYINQIISDTLPEILPAVINAAGTLLLTLATALIDNLPIIIPAATDIILQLINALIDHIDEIINAGIELLLAVSLGLIEALPKLLDKIPEIIKALITAIKNNWPQIKAAGYALLITLANAFISKLPDLTSVGHKAINALGKLLLSLASGFGEVGRAIISGIIAGIHARWSSLTSTMTSLAKSALSAAKSILGIHSPSTVFENQVGEPIAEGIELGFEKSMPLELKKMQKILSLSVPEFSAVNNVTNNGTIGSTGEIVLTIDGHELARFLAPSMDSQLAFGRV